MHFDAVLSEFIHPCSKKWRRAQYSRGVDTAVCARALQMCVSARAPVRGKLLTQRSTPTIPSVLYARLVLSCSAYIESWHICDWTRMHALMVMHRRTLYENVDSAKIKVPFYTTDIDILSVALMHHIVIHCIDKSMNRYTPTDDTWTILPMLLLCVCVLIVVIHLLSTQGQRIKNILICVL